MTGKERLMRDRDLCAWWVSVAHDPRFDQICLLLNYDASASCDTSEKLKGVRIVMELMEAFTDNEPRQVVIPNPGIVHDFEHAPKPPSAETQPA